MINFGIKQNFKLKKNVLFKQEEEKYVSSSEKPKLLSIDNYFITEQEQTVSNAYSQSNSKKQIVK